MEKCKAGEHFPGQRIESWKIQTRFWRRGNESNIPRLGERADNGFEDREGHQAPITLHEALPTIHEQLPTSFDLLKQGVSLRKLAGLKFGINLFPVHGNFKSSTAGRNQFQRADFLL